MDLGAYLSSQESSGQWDSVGGFTIAAEKAREKMAKFALEHPGLYVLKLIQATVALGSLRAGISFHECSMILWWDAPASEGLKSVVAAMENPLLAPSEGWRLLAEGVNISMFQDPTRLSLSCWTETTARCLRLREQQWEVGSARERPRELSSAPHFWMLHIEKTRRSLLKGPFDAEERWVRGSCSYLPLDFHLNGYPFAQRPEPGRDQSWLADFTDPFWLCEKLEPQAGAPIRLAVPSQAGRQRRGGRWLRTEPSRETFSLEPLVSLDMTSADCRAAYYVPITLAGPDKVAFVKNGVVVQTIIVEDRGAGALAILDAAQMTFDASGLNLVRDDKLDRALSETGRVWLAMLGGVRPFLPELTGEVTSRAFEKAGSCAGYGCLSLFCLFPPVLVVSLMFGVAYTGRWLLGGQPDKDAVCRQNIANRLDWLIGTDLWPYDPFSSPST